MDIKDLIGNWRTKDFPPFIKNDDIEIILHISGTKIGTLWLMDKEKNSKTLSEGKVTLNKIDNDKFEINLDGLAMDPVYLRLSCRMHIPRKPASMVINIPEYGERYFQKLEEAED